MFMLRLQIKYKKLDIVSIVNAFFNFITYFGLVKVYIYKNTKYNDKRWKI